MKICHCFIISKRNAYKRERPKVNLFELLEELFSRQLESTRRPLHDQHKIIARLFNIEQGNRRTALARGAPLSPCRFYD